MEDSSRKNPRCGVGGRNLAIVSGCNGQIQPTTRPGSPHPKPWGGFGDPEMKRRKRIAMYKSYTVQGKIKASIRNGLRWFKNKCSEIIH